MSRIPMGLESLTGLPASPKKASVRRGGGRGKGSGAKPTTPNDHLAKLTNAVARGDHAAAKSHALTLANALHQISKTRSNGPTKSAAEESQEYGTSGDATNVY